MKQPINLTPQMGETHYWVPDMSAAPCGTLRRDIDFCSGDLEYVDCLGCIQAMPVPGPDWPGRSPAKVKGNFRVGIEFGAGFALGAAAMSVPLAIVAGAISLIILAVAG